MVYPRPTRKTGWFFFFNDLLFQYLRLSTGAVLNHYPVLFGALQKWHDQSIAEPGDAETRKREGMQLKPACYLVRRWTERERCCVCVRLRERACGRTGAAGLPWFSGVVILTVDPGRAVYFHPSPCEWRSNQAWDGLSSLSGWGMRGDGIQRHRAGPNHDGRTLNTAATQAGEGRREGWKKLWGRRR